MIITYYKWFGTKARSFEDDRPVSELAKLGHRMLDAYGVFNAFIIRDLGRVMYIGGRDLLTLHPEVMVAL